MSRNILILIALIVFVVAPAVAFAGPLMQFEQVLYDFGTVQEGTILEHEFGFENTGDEELVIKKLEST